MQDDWVQEKLILSNYTQLHIIRTYLSLLYAKTYKMNAISQFVNRVLQMFVHVAGPISDKKDILDDLELQVDPTPLSREEEAELALFIRQHKEKTAAT